jgi:hypothetical protein
VLFVLMSQVQADPATRPFWAEKTSFIEGNDLYVVGVASGLPTREQARQQAFEHGKMEVMNFAQVPNLKALGLVVETQMTHEEPNQDGTITVFRLLRVPIEKILALQRRGQSGGATATTVQQYRAEWLKRQPPQPALTDHEREILQTYKRAVDRIDRQSRQACALVRPGMTRAEVKAMLGQPSGDSQHEDAVWAYGNTDVFFTHSGIVDSISGNSCRK